MRVVVKDDLLIVAPQTDEERAALSTWKTRHGEHLLRVNPDRGTGLALTSAGPRAVVSREPVVVSLGHPHPAIRLIDNGAETPFELDGTEYPSVAAFWRSLYPPGGTGLADYGWPIRYRGQDIIAGTWDHWQLIKAACLAKFTQHAAARQALLGTESQPLVVPRNREWRSMPGSLLCDIWTEIRDRLREEPRWQTESYRGCLIDSFDAGYRWLSNFWPVVVQYEGVAYPSVEHAYQAAKTEILVEREMIRTAATAGEAKRLSYEITKRAGWATMKVGVMESLLRQKFADPILAAKLIGTADSQIIEGNTWGDTFWGVCKGVGENWLGRLLTAIRSDLTHP